MNISAEDEVGEAIEYWEALEVLAAPKQSSGVLTPCLHCRLASVLGAAHVLEPPTGTEQSQGATRVLLMVMEPPRAMVGCFLPVLTKNTDRL